MSNLQNVFQGRSFLACKDFKPAELEYLIDFALHLKELKKKNIPHRYLEGKNIALLFEKASTRTRSAFVVACHDLGAHPEYMGNGEIHLGKKRIDQGHGAGAGQHVRRHRIPRLRPQGR